MQTILNSSLQKRNVLYLSYDGMLEPLGESQVLGYLTKMSQAGDFAFTLVSFEKEADLVSLERVERLKRLCAEFSIDWIPLKYHRKPVLIATFYDLSICLFVASKVCFTKKIDLVHSRSYVTSVIALLLKLCLKKRFIFDMRGFWADERADGGQWSRSSRIYKTIKWLEQQFLLKASAVVSLTHAGVKEMNTFSYLKSRKPIFAVIPTCADLNRFQLDPVKIKNRNVFLLGHIGSIGSWYLFDEALQFFKELLEVCPQARLLVVNRGEHAKIRSSISKSGVDPARINLRSAEHVEMPALMATLDACVFFIKPYYSKKASAPTKLAELLGCGVPSVVNSNVGDMDFYYRQASIGISVDNYYQATLHSAAVKLIELVSQNETSLRCRQTAVKFFSSDQGAQDYLNLYRQILLNT